jgi:hypothetical protein
LDNAKKFLLEWRGRWATSWNENEIPLQSDVCRPGKIGYKQGNKWESAGS